MAHITPPAPRARIEENGTELRVVVPARRNGFVLLFCPIWLLGWTIGEVGVMVVLFAGLIHGKADGPPLLFLLAWLCGWTVGGAWVWFTFLWNLCGREEITACHDTFSVRYAIGRWGKTCEFDPRLIKRFEMQNAGFVPFAWLSWFENQSTRMGGYQTGIWHGPLAFDYGAKTYRFGAGMDEAEARDLLPHLLRRLSPDDPKSPVLDDTNGGDPWQR